MQIRAAVLRAPDRPHEAETIELRGPGPGAVLVRIAGVGMCQTDLSLLRTPGLLAMPVIGGHEGAGVVEAVGAGVTTVAPGDHVVLTFDSCGTCAGCLDARPMHCATFAQRNIAPCDPDGSVSAWDGAGDPVGNRWFAQSSFATHAIATTRNVIKVDHDLPLELLGPLGCGVQTGAGAVLNAIGARAGDSIGVFGTGTVGLSAVLAARAAGAGRIVAVDTNQSRLKLAEQLGATDTLLGSGDSVGDEIGALDHAVDTTGVPAVIKTAIAAARPGGAVALVGVLSGALNLDMYDLGVGRRLIGVVECDGVPQSFVPRLIDLWRRGLFPFDKLISRFPLSEINAAEQAALRGDVVKPVLIPEHRSAS